MDVVQIDRWIVDSASVVDTHIPRVCRFSASELYVTVGFEGGANPNITGGIMARRISPAAASLTISDTKYNETTGALIFESKSFDSVTDADKVFPIRDETDQFTEPDVLLAAASLATTAGTYYPSATGYNMNGYRNISFEWSLVSGVTGTVTLTFEASNDTPFPASPRNITLAGYELVINGHAASYTANTGATTSGIIDFDNINTKYVRAKLVVANLAAGAVRIVARRSY